MGTNVKERRFRRLNYGIKSDKISIRQILPERQQAMDRKWQWRPARCMGTQYVNKTNLRLPGP